MTIVPIAEVKAKLSAYLNAAKKSGPIVITRNGKAVAVLLAPQSEADLESLILSRSVRFRALLEKSRRSLGEGSGLDRDRFWSTAKRSAAKKAKVRARQKRTAGEARRHD
jgi:prevent-host-death family protein